MSRLSIEARGRIRAQAHAAARSRIERDFGRLILAASPEQVEPDWVRAYVGHFVRAEAFYLALELSGGDHGAAREILASAEIRAEIDARVERDTAEIVEVAQ